MSRPRAIVWCSGIVGAALLCYFFPFFHIQRIDAPGDRNQDASAPLNVADFAQEFWETQLPDACGEAVAVEELFDAVDHDPVQARREFGRQVGLGGPYFFFVRGVGRVNVVAEDYCLLEFGERSRRVSIQTDVIVGNAVRDATGLIDVSQFANSQDLNTLSAELNRKVETHVIRPSRESLTVGARVNFVGCGQAAADSDFDALYLVPVKLEIVGPEVRP